MHLIWFCFKMSDRVIYLSIFFFHTVPVCSQTITDCVVLPWLLIGRPRFRQLWPLGVSVVTLFRLMQGKPWLQNTFKMLHHKTHAWLVSSSLYLRGIWTDSTQLWSNAGKFLSPVCGIWGTSPNSWVLATILLNNPSSPAIVTCFMFTLWLLTSHPVDGFDQRWRHGDTCCKRIWLQVYVKAVRAAVYRVLCGWSKVEGSGGLGESSLCRPAFNLPN